MSRLRVHLGRPMVRKAAVAAAIGAVAVRVGAVIAGG